MNLIEIRKEKEKLLKQKEYLTKVNGSSALKLDKYQEPNIKKIKVTEPNKKIFMGCWRVNYQLNEGDGC